MMRLSVGIVACVATWTFITPQFCFAGPLSNEDGQPVGVRTVQPGEWISLDARPFTPDSDNASSAWSPRDSQPVLLPLPPEGWAGASLLLTMACYRAFRRARMR